MALRNILKAFEACPDLPMDLDAVAAWLKKQGFQDEIEFIGVELDIGVIRGFLHRFRYPKGAWDAGTVDAANIYYATNQEPEWINMVCAKELVHIGDGSAPVKRKETLEHLIERLAMPVELKVLLEDPEYALMDKYGEAFACALLLPMAARAELMPSYKERIITDIDIARLAVMPEQYARMVMSDAWEKAYAKMCEM